MFSRKFRPFAPPFLPMYFFGAVILLGGALLHSSPSLQGESLSWLDALFTAVSATCVTGLAVVDTATVFSRFGHTVLMVLIQIGGLGVMTYTSLAFYLWRRRITVTDRIAVGQSLLSDPGFHLGRFLLQLLVVSSCIEALGALALFCLLPPEAGWFTALFHSVSAFCNAGFSLYSESLVPFAAHIPLNFVFMLLIFLGGIGFYVLLELPGFFRPFFLGKGHFGKLSWQARIVLQTSFWLIALGAGVFFIAELATTGDGVAWWQVALHAVFQSVSARTAGFNSVNIGGMTDAALFAMIVLMLVGGSPGSCAGGIKTSTLRVLLGFGVAQIKGRDQVVVAQRAIDHASLNKALTLFIVSVLLVLGAVFVLSFSEGANAVHTEVRGKFLEICFEVVSAFGTVGLSTGLTPHLSATGKVVLMLLMFVGRLGPVVFLSMLQSWQTAEHFRRAERSMLIG